MTNVTNIKKKKEFFNLGLYIEALKRIRLPGIILSVILTIEAILIPVGYELNYLMNYVWNRYIDLEEQSYTFTPEVLSGTELHTTECPVLFLIHKSARSITSALLRKTVFAVVQDQQASFLYSNGSGASCKMIADAQGEAGSQHGIFKRILKTLDGDAPGISAHTEDGDDPLGVAIEAQTSVFQHGHKVMTAYQIAPGALICQELQRLKIRQRMVQSRAVQTAIQHKPAVAQLQTAANGKHRVGIVFFHGKNTGVFRYIAQRVKVPQNFVGGQTQTLCVDKTAVSSQQAVLRSDGLDQAVKFTGIKNHTGFQCSTLLASYFLLF